MKKIGISLLYSVTGTGIGVYTRNLVEKLGLIDINHRYVIFKNDTVKLNTANPNFTVLSYKLPERLKLKKILLENLHLPNVAKRENIDLFHFTSFIVPYVYSGNFVLTINDLAFLKYPHIIGKSRLCYYKMFLKNAVKKSRFIITISEATRNDVLEYYKYPEERINTVYLGIGNEFLKGSEVKDGEEKTVVSSGSSKAGDRNNILQKYGIKERFILFVGTLEPRKNILNLIKAFNRVKDKDVQLLICGKKGWMYDDIYRELSRHSLRGRVVTVNTVSNEELAELYKKAELFILPSLYEGFGLPVLEAMAAGTPVITSDVSSLPEVAGDAALYVDPHDDEDIADKISIVLDDEHLKSGMVKKGYEQIKNFSWEKCAKETLRVYREVLGE